MPIALTEEMTAALDNAIADRAPCIVASASADGMPDLSYRGSIMVFDAGHLAYWERAKGETLANLQENPRLAVLYRNPATRVGWRFYGVAEIITSGPVRDEVMARVNPLELAQDPERQGYAVLIRIDRVRDRTGVIMQREE